MTLQSVCGCTISLCKYKLLHASPFTKPVFGLLSAVQRKSFITTVKVLKAEKWKKHQHPYAMVFKDDMQNLSPKDIQDEISYLSNPQLGMLMSRQDEAQMDVARQRKIGELANIERKYFGRKRETCFLTWSMKEQVKQLHNLDSNLWTPENLSYVFPATVPEVKKLLRDKRRCPSPEKVKAHDMAILENWKKYGNGQFGNIQLLKKTIENRITEVGGSFLPSVPVGANPETLSYLSSLKFSKEDDDVAFQDEVSKKQLSRLKRKYPFKGTFKDIILNYENAVQGLKKLDSVAVKEDELVPCEDLSHILPTVIHSKTDVAVRINCDNVNNNSRSIKFKKQNRMMTYDDFKKLKVKQKKHSDRLL